MTRYPRKFQAENVNNDRLKAIHQPTMTYTATDVPGPPWREDKGDRERIVRITPAEAETHLNSGTLWLKSLELRVGAMVMLLVVRDRFTDLGADSRIWEYVP